mgnify:CR=1 FL=1
MAARRARCRSEIGDSGASVLGVEISSALQDRSPSVRAMSNSAFHGDSYPPARPVT